jgi:hypothetical protein
MTCIGLKSYAFDDNYREDKCDAGKKIIEKYKKENLLLLGKSTTKKKILPDLEK